MYTFGNIKEFAISYELEENYNGAWLFGKFCFWIGGKMVGDYELGTSLRDILAPLRWMVIDNGNRENIILFKLSSEELHTRLDNTLCGGGETSEYEELALIETWARFQISPSVDIFDEWKIYLIDSPPKSRIAYSFCEGNVVEFNLAAGIFDLVIANVFNTLFDIYELEVAKVET
jgi:Immunity protein 42